MTEPNYISFSFGEIEIITTRFIPRLRECGSRGIGPVQFGTIDGKPFIGTGVKFRTGFILGVVLGGSMGIRKK